MTDLQLLLVLAVLTLGSALGCFGLLRWTRWEKTLTTRIASVRGDLRRHGGLSGSEAAGSRTAVAVRRIGEALARSGLLSARIVSDVEQTLVAAGMRGRNALALFVGTKAVLLVSLPAAAFLFSQATGLGRSTGWLFPGMFAAAGLIVPDVAVRRIRKRYLKRVERGLPDALDMMVICAEAGLGLDAGIERVAREIRQAHPAVANEFGLTASELHILADRRSALLNMGARTGVEALSRLAATLVQTVTYGTPLTQALRTLAAEMRQEQLTAFEARAARLPVLLTVPMIVFILPPLFIVIGGPAVIQTLASFE